jgi:hypothetical protein
MLYPKWEVPLRQARQETNQQALLRVAGEAELALIAFRNFLRTRMATRKLWLS